MHISYITTEANECASIPLTYPIWTLGLNIAMMMEVPLRVSSTNITLRWFTNFVQHQQVMFKGSKLGQYEEIQEIPKCLEAQMMNLLDLLEPHLSAFLLNQDCHPKTLPNLVTTHIRI